MALRSNYLAKSLGVVTAACLSLLWACSCSSSNAVVQTPVDLKIAKIADLKDGGIASNGQNEKDAECRLRLVAANIIKSSSGCYLDEHVSEGPGELRYPCDGNGHAEAVFGGEQRFEGEVSKGVLRITATTELDWEDGCRWGTMAAISGFVPTMSNNPDGVTGNISSGGNRLQWSYADHVMSGSTCSGVCTAQAVIAISQAHSGSTPSAPQPDEEDDDSDP